MNSSFRRICGENTRVAPVRDGLGILRFSQFFCTAVIAAILPLWPQLECGQSHIKNRTFNAGKPPKKAVFLRKVVRVTGFEPAASCSQSRRATSCATPGYVLFSAAACVCTHFKKNGAFCRTHFPQSRSAAACAFRLHRRQTCTFCNLRKIKFNTFFRNSQRFSALQFRVGCGMLYK